ncbi:hypothetical protein [Solicola sp. PLA-1-18]|uniref:hypothetical protein n=1 Tax=Solicola sp. PLA-1-18 TaxID=3380532 RepID=UPI003B774A1B
MRPSTKPRWTVPAAVAAAVATQVVALPALASADEPTTWAAGENLSTLYVVIVFVAVPIVLFVLIGMLGLIGKHKTYPRPNLGQELEPSEQRFGEVGAAEQRDEGTDARAGSTGGASATW